MTLLASRLYRSLGLTLAAVCLIMSGAIYLLNPTEIVGASIERLEPTSEKPEQIRLPYSGSATDGVQRFHVRVDAWNSIFSSGRFRVSVDDCLQSIRLNGEDVRETAQTRNAYRCKWRKGRRYYHLLDLSQQMRIGSNNVEFEIINLRGGYGMELVPAFSGNALVAMTTLLGVSLYLGALVCLEASPGIRAASTSRIGRALEISFLPCLGLLGNWAAIANSKGSQWVYEKAVFVTAAFVVPVALLLSLAGKLFRHPVRHPMAAVLVATSVGAFSYTTSLFSLGQWSSPSIRWFILGGCLAGFFIATPLLPTLRQIRCDLRTLVITVLAALCPYGYWTLNLAFWGYLAPVTGALVQGILWLCGYPTTTSSGTTTSKNGRTIDNYIYVSSSDFSVQIGAGCSGFEGVALFLFLLCLFVLIDWKLFSKVRHLWKAFVVTIPFVLVVNVLRIAGLFLYAEWNHWQYGRTQAVAATVEAFHSHIGWVIYAVAFALYLPAVYRWAHWSRKIK